jgi:hypothetical protein
MVRSQTIYVVFSIERYAHKLYTLCSLSDDELTIYICLAWCERYGRVTGRRVYSNGGLLWISLLRSSGERARRGDAALTAERTLRAEADLTLLKFDLPTGGSVATATQEHTAYSQCLPSYWPYAHINTRTSVPGLVHDLTERLKHVLTFVQLEPQHEHNHQTHEGFSLSVIVRPIV